jgi:hypothetical protein
LGVEKCYNKFVDEELRKLERLAKTGDEDALLALSQMRLRSGRAPILRAYAQQLQIAKKEIVALENLGSEHLLAMLAEVFQEYFRKYGDVIDCVLWRLGTRYVSETGRPLPPGIEDRIIGWYFEGPFLQFESNLARILTEGLLLPLGKESTNFPRGPLAVSIIEELRIPGWESVIGLKKLVQRSGYNLAGLAHLGDQGIFNMQEVSHIKTAVKELVDLNLHLESIKNHINSYLRNIMQNTKSDLLYFIITHNSFEIYSADHQRRIESIPFDPISRHRFRRNPNEDPEDDEVITVLCAWCGKHMRGPPLGNTRPSHGICRECYERVIADNG